MSRYLSMARRHAVDEIFERHGGQGGHADEVSAHRGSQQVRSREREPEAPLLGHIGPADLSGEVVPQHE
jgi:hypothetical protein